VNITQAALDVLAGSTCEPGHLRLPAGPLLPRKVYAEVDQILTRLGGKWNRRTSSHTFGSDPTGLIADVLDTGQMPVDADKLASFWRTPRPVAERLVAWAVGQPDLPAGPGVRVLEPSAGDGAIASVVTEWHPAVSLTCVEPDPGRAGTLKADGFLVHPVDFRDYHSLAAEGAAAPFDGVVMNPPFTEPGKPRAWAEHVTLAYDLLVHGGRLAAIVPASVEHSTVRAVADLRAWVTAAGGSWKMLPDGVFRESGTDVRTSILTVTAP
jgi:predicted RNA methylase